MEGGKSLMVSLPTFIVFSLRSLLNIGERLSDMLVAIWATVYPIGIQRYMKINGIFRSFWKWIYICKKNI